MVGDGASNEKRIRAVGVLTVGGRAQDELVRVLLFPNFLDNVFEGVTGDVFGGEVGD